MADVAGACGTETTGPATGLTEADDDTPVAATVGMSARGDKPRDTSASPAAGGRVGDGAAAVRAEFPEFRRLGVTAAAAATA
ncbi:MAG: hypothetical protein ACOYEV_15815 [Candidatus Nanopelagicales bacterium]